MFRRSILSIFGCLGFLQSFLLASPIVNTEDHPGALIEMAELLPDRHFSRDEFRELRANEQLLQRIENRLDRKTKAFSSKHSKRTLGGFSDPVDKWFWIWAIAWGLGILLTIVTGGSLTGVALGLIWLFAFGLGSVALVLWLVKKFG